MADNERLIETLFGVIRDALENVHTATIARVETVNEKTLDLQPVIARRVRGEVHQRPPLKDVPVVTLQGGSSYSAPPIAVGDYVLVVMGERCFDRWWDGQDGRPPLEARMHDLSDAVAIAGLKPSSDAVPIPSIWTEIGDRYQEGNWELVGDHVQTGKQTQTGDREQTGNQTITGNLHVDGNVTVTGNLTVQGTIAASGFSGLNGGPMSASVSIETTESVVAGTDVEAAGTSLTGHTHTDSQGGTTSPPDG